MHDGSDDPTAECEMCSEEYSYEIITFCEDCEKAYCDDCYNDTVPCKICDVCDAMKCNVVKCEDSSTNICLECIH